MSLGILPMPVSISFDGISVSMTVVNYTDGGTQADKVVCRDLSQPVRATRKHRTGSINNRQDLSLTILFDPDTDFAQFIGIQGDWQTDMPKKDEASASGALWDWTASVELYEVGEAVFEDVDGQEEVTQTLLFHQSAAPVVTAEA